MQQAFSSIRKWLSHYCATGHICLAGHYWSLQGSQLGNTADPFPFQEMYTAPSDMVKAKAFQVNTNFISSCSTMSSAIRPHHQVLEGNHKQWWWPVMLRGAHGTQWPIRLKQKSCAWHLSFHVLAYGIWWEHCPRYRMTLFKLHLYLCMSMC